MAAAAACDPPGITTWNPWPTWDECQSHAQAKLAACNVAGRLSGYPMWNSENVLPFVDGAVNDLPRACPKLLNATELGIPSA